MFEKPPTIENKNDKKERIVTMGADAIDRELEIKNPKRMNAFVLATFLAMFGAIGEAKADWKSVVLGPRGIGGTITGEVGGAIDQRERNKRQEITNEYLEQKKMIMLNLQALEKNYRQEKIKYQHAGNQKKIDELEENYKKEKGDLTKLHEENEKKYHSQLQNQKIRREIKDRIMIGIRGW